MNKLHVKKGDLVELVSGKQKGKRGKVLTVSPKDQKVIVEGINMVTKHTKPRKAGQQGGRIHQESPIYACKVMHVCSRCDQTTRIARRVLDNGDKVRYCKHCEEIFND